MALSYKNYAKDHILHSLRNIRYANAEMMFGFYNNISIELELKLDKQNLLYQADLFASEMLTHRSVIDFKKFLGSYQEDWKRILIETYVYDRLKCIYYGINSKYMHTIPGNLVSFPGNIILMNALSMNSFIFSTNDSQPFNLYFNITYNDDVEELFEQVFETIPILRQVISDAKGVYTFISFQYESVLKGLYNLKTQKMTQSKSNNGRGSSDRLSNLYYINNMNDDSIKSILIGDSNPLLNSFFSKDGLKFYFIMPIDKSVPEALRFNESLFISRAIGLTGNQHEIGGNNVYTVANVNQDVDRLIREDLYSVTGIKTEQVYLSMDQIKYYLDINSYVKEAFEEVFLKEKKPSQ